jgi:class 3 adenylate cyclase/pimeloyl-ACP methyl ester carboxylesterase
VPVSEVEYARAEDGAHVAYRVLAADASCDPGTDIVMVAGGLIPMEVFEDDPGFARLLEGLCSLGRVVVFDRRGVGLSDPIVDWDRPTLDQWADDLAAVVEASGAREAAVFAWDGFGVATRFAARHADRLRLLVLYEPLALSDDRWDIWITEWHREASENLGGRKGSLIDRIAPSRLSDASFRDWYTRAGQVGASPTTAARIWDSVFSSRPNDQLLDQVETPTLLLHRPDNAYFPAEAVRVTASRIARARIVALDGVDHWPFIGDVDAVVAEIADFVVGERRLPPAQRVLAAMMFTDLVASTEHTASVGDARWKSVLARHDEAIRAVVGSCGGWVVKGTGDGVLATLPSAGAAVRAAARVRDVLTADGLRVRIGIHLADIDLRDDDVSGLGVVVAARVMAVADAGQIVVTASVVAAVIGQTATFEPLAAHELKGIPGTWPLYQLADTI